MTRVRVALLVVIMGFALGASYVFDLFSGTGPAVEQYTIPEDAEWKETLDIILEDAESTNSKSKTAASFVDMQQYATSTEEYSWLTYKNTEFGFSFEYPNYYELPIFEENKGVGTNMALKRHNDESWSREINIEIQSRNEAAHEDNLLITGISECKKDMRENPDNYIFWGCPTVEDATNLKTWDALRADYEIGHLGPVCRDIDPGGFMPNSEHDDCRNRQFQIRMRESIHTLCGEGGCVHRLNYEFFHNDNKYTMKSPYFREEGASWKAREEIISRDWEMRNFATMMKSLTVTE